ncbi:MAG: hypothetical protein SPI72_05330 [Porphyromonas sp.]|nr:hypothetical protein [Porphyromonas sp.]
METILLTLVLALGLVALGVVLLAIKVILVKGGRFPTGHTSDIPAFRKKGIGCHRSQMREEEQRLNLADRLRRE